jgi:hypothetical protein
MNNSTVKQQNKRINEAVKLINKRIPKHYPRVSVVIFTYVDSMLRSTAREHGISYYDLCSFFSAYRKDTKRNNTDYIKTKYYNAKHTKKKYKVHARTITALSGHPIYINIENTNKHTVNNYLFILLHELGHNYYKDKKSLKWSNEKEVDKFAIMWYKRIVTSLNKI